MRFPLLMMISLPMLAETDSADALLEAVRKGDATAVRALLALGAMSELTFRPLEFNGLTIEFKLEGPGVAGLTLRDWGQPTECARAEGTGP